MNVQQSFHTHQLKTMDTISLLDWLGTYNGVIKLK